jgi:mRNA-degrading endonuclease toxin of MazEF toxin-antitoxin module
VVNVSQVLTVNKPELDERTGNLSADLVAAIREGLQLLFGRR